MHEYEKWNINYLKRRPIAFLLSVTSFGHVIIPVQIVIAVVIHLAGALTRFFSALVSPADKTRFSWRIKLEPKKRTDALAGNHTSDVNKGNMAFQDWQLLPSCKSAKFLSLQVHNDKTTIPTKIVLGNYFEKHAVFLSYYGKLDFQSFHDEDCRMLAVS